MVGSGGKAANEWFWIEYVTVWKKWPVGWLTALIVMPYKGNESINYSKNYRKNGMWYGYD